MVDDPGPSFANLRARKAASGSAPACAVAVLLVLMPLECGATSVTMPGGPTISVPNFHYTPPPRPTPPAGPGPSGPTYAPPVYQPSPAELQQQRSTAINNQGLVLAKGGNHAAGCPLIPASFGAGDQCECCQHY
jgi:hypothetical protein